MADLKKNLDKWMVLAEVFPPSMVTAMDSTALKDGQTPDSYGLGVERKASLYYSTSERANDGVVAASNKTAVASPTNAPTGYGAITWYLWFDRLWGISAQYVFYGAKGYSTRFIQQGKGRIDFDDDSDAYLVAMVPFGESIAVFKSAAIYVIASANGNDGHFNRTGVTQNYGIAAGTQVCEIDGTVFFSNATGVYSFNGQQIQELTAAVRGRSGFFPATLTANFRRKYLVMTSGTNVMAMDLQSGNIYDYSTSGFRWTSRTLVDKTNAPIGVYDAALEVEFLDSNVGTVTYEIGKDGVYGDATAMRLIPTEPDQAVRVKFGLEATAVCTKFNIRLSLLSTNVLIKRVLINSTLSGVEAYRE